MKQLLSEYLKTNTFPPDTMVHLFMSNKYNKFMSNMNSVTNTNLFGRYLSIRLLTKKLDTVTEGGYMYDVCKNLEYDSVVYSVNEGNLNITFLINGDEKEIRKNIANKEEEFRESFHKQYNSSLV